MPHADAASLPTQVKSKKDFWVHVHDQLKTLLGGQRNWVSNLANASSLIYNSLLTFSEFGSGDKQVNWCGFYIDSHLFPSTRFGTKNNPMVNPPLGARLLLGPFCGKPACQLINTAPQTARGICADTAIQQQTILVPDVNAYPGHIACDADTKSEIVCPLIVGTGTGGITVGVLDLDCLALAGFCEEDREGLEKIAQLISKACDW